MKRNGDAGMTAGLNGQALSKNDAAVHFAGTADELNAHLGLVKAMLGDAGVKQFIEKVQKNIVRLVAHVSDSANGEYAFSCDEAAELEDAISRLSENIPAQTGFILPGKDIAEAHIHIARTVARRAERRFFAVSELQPLNPGAGAYLNRLSDYLFALSLL